MKDQSDHMDQIDHHYNTCTLQARNLKEIRWRTAAASSRKQDVIISLLAFHTSDD